MRARGLHHGLIRGTRAAASARVLALLVAAASLSAQVSTLLHDAEVQHIRCAEHGELTHVEAQRADVATPAQPGGAVDRAPAGPPDAHEHCAVVFAVQGGAHAPVVRAFVRFTPPPVVARPAAAPAPRPGRTFVLASAPKTSPPSA
jgi:hypothetical protein